MILVNAALYQPLRHITDLPLYGLQIQQRRQRVLRAPAPLNVRLRLMLIAPVRILHGRRFALLSIPAEPLASPIVAVPLFRHPCFWQFRCFGNSPPPPRYPLTRIPKGLCDVSQIGAAYPDRRLSFTPQNRPHGRCPGHNWTSTKYRYPAEATLL
jgi:hypothetical protein